MTVVIVIISTRECGRETVHASGRRILQLIFYNVPAPLKPPHSSCLGLQSFAAGSLQTQTTKASCCSGSKGGREVGEGRGRKREVEKACPPRDSSLGPSRIPLALQCGPSTACRCASCQVTWLVFQNVTSSCWPLVLAINTMTKKWWSCEVSPGTGAAAVSRSTWVGSEPMGRTRSWEP